MATRKKKAADKRARGTAKAQSKRLVQTNVLERAQKMVRAQFMAGPEGREVQRRAERAARAFSIMKYLDTPSLVSDAQLNFIKMIMTDDGPVPISSLPPQSPAPRASGSESSFAFTSRDEGGRTTTRFTDKNVRRKGEKRRRFE